MEYRQNKKNRGQGCNVCESSCGLNCSTRPTVRSLFIVEGWLSYLESPEGIDLNKK